MNMKQIYHRYEFWEDYKNGLFNDNCILEDQIILSAKLLKNIQELQKSMEHVIKNWKYSSEINLSNISMNRRAWLGQAACCYKVGSNETETKLAWRTLTEKQQNKANGVADLLIKKWEENNINICQKQYSIKMF